MKRQVKQFCHSCVKCQGIEPRIVDDPSEHGSRSTIYGVNGGVEVKSWQWDVSEADGQIVESKYRNNGTIGAGVSQGLSDNKEPVMLDNDSHNRVWRKNENYYSHPKRIWAKRKYFVCNICKESFWSHGCRQYHMSTIHAGRQDTRQRSN